MPFQAGVGRTHWRSRRARLTVRRPPHDSAKCCRRKHEHPQPTPRSTLKFDRPAAHEEASERREGGPMVGDEAIERFCQRTKAWDLFVQAQPEAAARIYGQRPEDGFGAAVNRTVGLDELHALFE